jgi:hypothetical protein
MANLLAMDDETSAIFMAITRRLEGKKLPQNIRETQLSPRALVF